VTEELSSLRQRLDSVDAALLDALAQRSHVIQEIARQKAGGEGAVRDVPREQEVLSRVAQQARDAGLDPFFVTRLFREILDHSVRCQHQNLVDTLNPGTGAAKRLVVGYQGVEGAYSHIAATRHFAARNADAEFRGINTFAELMDAVRDGDVDYAMLPIENTTAGSINDAYDLLARMNLALIGEEVERIDHCLLALEAVPLTRIHRVYSHPQAIVQCSQFLDSLKDCHVEAYADTAGAARKIREDQDLSEAAIASEEAGRLYGLQVIRRGITNQKDNFTRFVVVAREPVKYDLRIPCKTSVIFATRHEEGALVAALNSLAAHHLNLTKLESRPRPNTPWEYLFYVDFEGNVAEERVQDALRALAAHTSFQKILGSYPARTTREARPAEPRPAIPTPTQPRPQPAPAAAPEPSVMKMLEKMPYKLVSRAQRAKDTVIHVKNVEIGGPRPVIIAGPCSVESRDQILQCARIVKELGGDILRGGCFKPRTSPYAFQGMGYEGLDLLEEAGRTYGLPIITEVMHPADVERVARQSDILQIGARNMQNFSLLKELGRVDRPVMLKRGLMASIDEWLGAAEYILAHGNQQVILCERGIRTFETATRNTLDLSAVPVARERTHLPIVVDPSHACGTWRWIPAMSQAALACGSNGIMVEVHPNPEQALSDGPQALTFDVFRSLMEKLHKAMG